MAEKLLQHKHCSICGKAVPLGKDFCGDECKAKMEASVKKKRLWMYLFYGLMGLFIAMILFSGF